MLGSLLAVLGVVAVAAVVRTRWRVRHSLYESLRTERQQQIEQARARALGDSAPPAGRPSKVVESEGALAVRETPFQVVLGYAALLGAVVIVLFGVVVLLGAR